MRERGCTVARIEQRGIRGRWGMGARRGDPGCDGKDAGLLHGLIFCDRGLPVSGRVRLPGDGLTVVGESVR